MDIGLFKQAGKNKPKGLLGGNLHAPSLFAEPDEQATVEERRFSVLSAAGGKSVRRPVNRLTTPAQASTGKKTYFYILLILSALPLIVFWQIGTFDKAVGSKMKDGFFTFQKVDSMKRETEYFPPEGQARAQQAPLGQNDPRTTGRPAVIEKLTVSTALDKEILETKSITPVHVLRAELTPEGFSRKTVAKGMENKTSTQPSGEPNLIAKNNTRVESVKEAKPLPESPPKIMANNERQVSRISLAKAKEPDADVQLLEALLVHLRKSETAKSK